MRTIKDEYQIFLKKTGIDNETELPEYLESAFSAWVDCTLSILEINAADSAADRTRILVKALNGFARDTRWVELRIDDTQTIAEMKQNMSEGYIGARHVVDVMFREDGMGLIYKLDHLHIYGESLVELARKSQGDDALLVLMVRYATDNALQLLAEDADTPLIRGQIALWRSLERAQHAND